MVASTTLPGVLDQWIVVFDAQFCSQQEFAHLHRRTPCHKWMEHSVCVTFEMDIMGDVKESHDAWCTSTSISLPSAPDSRLSRVGSDRDGRFCPAAPGSALRPHQVDAQRLQGQPNIAQHAQ